MKSQVELIKKQQLAYIFAAQLMYEYISRLNPSYDTYAEWELEGEDINQHAMNNVGFSFDIS